MHVTDFSLVPNTSYSFTLQLRMENEGDDVVAPETAERNPIGQEGDVDTVERHDGKPEGEGEGAGEVTEDVDSGEASSKDVSLQSTARTSVPPIHVIKLLFNVVL